MPCWRWYFFVLEMDGYADGGGGGLGGFVGGWV